MSGYIGTQPVPQATQTRQTFTATASQTSFATGGYQAGYLDVFLNGVKLVDGTDYTATNGSDVVLTTGAASGDTLEVVAYTAFEVLNQNFTGGVTVDNDGATVLTVDRATSDGTIIDVQKDGTSVGSIGSYFGEINFGSGNTRLTYNNASSIIYPVDSTSQFRNGVVDLGYSASRFKDLYLSGGVYLGGTGSANKLDDYETGTWTPTFAGLTIGNGTVSGTYTKIGRQVTVVFGFDCGSTTSVGTLGNITGLPFASANIWSGYIKVHGVAFDSGSRWYEAVAVLGNNSNTIFVPSITNYNSGISASNPMAWANNDTLVFTATYITT